MKRTELKRKTPMRSTSAIKTGTQPTFLDAPARRTGLKQGRSTGTPTKPQLQRWIYIREIGCIACMQQGHRPLITEVHHLTVGGKHGQKRRGHEYTIGLCRWHHRGCVPQPMTKPDIAREFLGPSYHHHARAFRETYGQDDSLLKLQNELIALRELDHRGSHADTDDV